jgi:hypothetical protein
MYEQFEAEGVEGGLQTWEQRFCSTEWCEEELLFVQRDTARHEVWRVAANQENHVWLVAGETPVCPFCGSHLLTAANLQEGIG